jgi:hypothetical protein
MVNGIGAAKINTVNDTAKMKYCSSLQLEVSPDRIHFLKFILEGYDGLALLTTINSRQGLIEIKYPPEVEKDLTNLLHNIAPQILKNMSTRT